MQGIHEHVHSAGVLRAWDHRGNGYREAWYRLATKTGAATNRMPMADAWRSGSLLNKTVALPRTLPSQAMIVLIAQICFSWVTLPKMSSVTTVSGRCLLMRSPCWGSHLLPRLYGPVHARSTADHRHWSTSKLPESQPPGANRLTYQPQGDH